MGVDQLIIQYRFNTGDPAFWIHDRTDRLTLDGLIRWANRSDR
jgi:hypothetical protein